ncbi:MAG: hypothetical protein A2142_06735 [candidate division Zixibacteria bacterium RBG_16_48_11]|nr:MAG: hypothetical protein A2142_06735 [candidate division Zixibacteria bacterium RBG_16_48_11]
MKRTLVAVVLILVLASSFVVGILTSPASAGKCDRFCDFCTCTMFKCCDGVCENLGPCRFACPLVPC